MLKRFWLGLTQLITVLVLIVFILWTLKPQWLPDAWLQNLSHNKTVPAFDDKTTLKPSQAPRNMTSLSYHDAVASALHSVVKIHTSRAIPKSPYSDPTLNQLFNENQSQEPNDFGSGVIIDPQGFIVTNFHVIQDADQIEVTLNDGKRVNAILVGSDPESDIAVLKVDVGQLPNITLGHDDELQVGDVVLAIGNPFGVGQSVSMGIVSALNRDQLGINTFENFIQTDAAINPGNSGGALVDSNGHLIGINTAILTRTTDGKGTNAGIGFAIPVSTMREVTDSIIKTGEFSRGYIGVSSQNITPEMAKTFNLPSNDGVIVANVRPDGPAGQAGLQVGDILTQVNDKPIKNTASMLIEVAKLKPGTVATLKILRNNQNLDVKVTITKRPITNRS